MSAATVINPNAASQPRQAVVVGGSITGLLVARVLSDYFDQVTIVERDELGDARSFRPGVPQARHAHTLLPPGQAILEQLFPGLIDELLAAGAVAIDPARDIAIYQDGGWRQGPPREQRRSISASRPLLEAALSRRVAARDNIDILHGIEISGLVTDGSGRRVSGIRLAGEHGTAGTSVLPGMIVVDASGRQSQAPRWLRNLGYPVPEEWRVDSFTGYATRLYRQPSPLPTGWKSLYVRPTPADGPRGGVILPLEGGRWYVSLIGMAGEYPPTNEQGFMDFARHLPVPDFYTAIRSAQPLTRPVGFRQTENRIRRYDRLPGYLEGFLVAGDAAIALNPVSALGMTASALGSRALAECLHERQAQLALGDVAGLAAAFQERLSSALAGVWHKTTEKEWRWPLTEVTDSSELQPA
jgi:2-polyprenyl-6-methoxyphenol hydroxylase-like FAD-dependent oxidoreductase